MALDDFDDRFANAVKLALDVSRSSGDYQADAMEGAECPSSDMIASYYEDALNRVERARLESHFSGCALCQGTLAALLRAAPTVDTNSEPGHLAGDAAHERAPEAPSLRERWLETSPPWRIAGVIGVATAMLVVIIVAGIRGYESRDDRAREQVAALSTVAPRNDRQQPHPAAGDTETALNDNSLEAGLDNKSSKQRENKALPPAAPAEPAPAVARSAAPAVSTPIPEAALPAQQPMSQVAPPDGEQNEATAATAAQAAAALGALASTPAPTASAAPLAGSAPATATAPSIARAPAVTAPPMASTPVTVGGTGPTAGPPSAANSTRAKTMAAKTATANTITAKTMAAKTRPNTVSAPASQVAASAIPDASAGSVNHQKQQRLSALVVPPPARVEGRAATPGAAKLWPSAPAASGLGIGGAGAAPNNTVGSAFSARLQAQQQLAQAQLAQDKLAEEKVRAENSKKAELVKKAELAKKIELAKKTEVARKAELTRKTELAQRAELAKKVELAKKAELARTAALARQAEQANRDADLRRRMELARREAQAKSAKSAASAQSVGAARAAAPSSTGNQVAMADRPVVSAPAVVAIAPGIPVAPHAVLIAAPDHSVYWSLQNSGVIYRTKDRKSWTPQFTGIQSDLLAGMAPSDTVCWAVGRKGAILLTTDGVNWNRITSPTGADIVGVTAASKDVATIFAASGVTYSTFDGGSNWEPAN